MDKYEELEKKIAIIRAILSFTTMIVPNNDSNGGYEHYDQKTIVKNVRRKSWKILDKLLKEIEG